MKYIKRLYSLIDNYGIARLQNRPSTALFWYLPEPANIQSIMDLKRYRQSKNPLYPINYCEKLNYNLKNAQGIIVLPYHHPIGEQINPEAAFQYALGLHDQFCLTKNDVWQKQFFIFADYFHDNQANDGLWHYQFDWFSAKAPWSSALAQARGASVMLRAWLISKNEKYLNAAKKSLAKFTVPTSQGGFLHHFKEENCFYFEEYPDIPTGVINGYMAALISIWELHYWTHEPWLNSLWTDGLLSLQKMLPYYTTGWWSLYDRDTHTPVPNVNSPRYHLLEMNYLKVLSILSGSSFLAEIYERRKKQYHKITSRYGAFVLKIIRKTLYK